MTRSPDASETPAPPLLILASASPRRRELLAGLGMRFEVEPAEADEAIHAGESPEAASQRIAAEKASVVGARRPAGLVLAADTLVVVDRPDGPQVLGKPRGREEARGMLRSLSGREHRVLTGIALRAPGGGIFTDVAETRVRFSRLEDRWIDWYVRTGEPDDKAGAYGVQGAAALFVERIDGSWTNVVGLPLERLPALFASAGFDLAAALGPPAGGAR